MGEPTPALHILIIRTSAIGDVIIASPVAKQIRAAYPEAQIAWLVERGYAALVAGNPYVDEIIHCDFGQWERWLRQGRWLTFTRSVWAFIRELRRRRFDVVIDLQGLYRSATVAWLSGAPRRIGLTPSREPVGPLYTARVPKPPDRARPCAGYMASLTALGITADSLPPILEVSAADEAIARKFLSTYGLPPKNYVACCIASSREKKEWPSVRWDEFLVRLQAETGLRAVLIGGPEKQSEAEQLAVECAAHPISAVGRMSLMQSAALVQHAAVVVGCDTGLTYAGLASAVPTVGLYGPTNPFWLRQEPNTAICRRPPPCSPCRSHHPCPERTCMYLLDADDVLAAMWALCPDLWAAVGAVRQPAKRVA